MQTSVINCSLPLNDDKLENSSDSCIFLAVSAKSLNSCFIALCQSNNSSKGHDIFELVGSSFSPTLFLLTVLEDPQIEYTFSLWLSKLLIPTSFHWTLVSCVHFLCFIFSPSIHPKMTLTSSKLKLKTSFWLKHPVTSCNIKNTYLMKKLLFGNYCAQATKQTLILIRWYIWSKPGKKFCHHFDRYATKKLPYQWPLLFRWRFLNNQREDLSNEMTEHWIL